MAWLWLVVGIIVGIVLQKLLSAKSIKEDTQRMVRITNIAYKELDELARHVNQCEICMGNSRVSELVVNHLKMEQAAKELEGLVK